jgi:hypothetical protein
VTAIVHRCRAAEPARSFIVSTQSFVVPTQTFVDLARSFEGSGKIFEDPQWLLYAVSAGSSLEQFHPNVSAVRKSGVAGKH